MKFFGVNALRINRETVKRTLIESFNSGLIGNDVAAVEMIQHEGGDITLKFEPAANAKKRAELQAQSPPTEPDALEK